MSSRTPSRAARIRIFVGYTRTTFIIDPEGKIKKIFPKVHVEGHTAEVLEAVKA